MKILIKKMIFNIPVAFLGVFAIRYLRSWLELNDHVFTFNALNQFFHSFTIVFLFGYIYSENKRGKRFLKNAVYTLSVFLFWAIVFNLLYLDNLNTSALIIGFLGGLTFLILLFFLRNRKTKT